MDKDSQGTSSVDCLQLLNTLDPNAGGVIARQVTLSREVHSAKAKFPILVTLLGIVTEVKEQPQKACSPMLVTLLGIVTEVRDPHQLKAPSPMLVTLLGIVTEVKEQPQKAFTPMLITLLGMIVFWQPAMRVLEAVSIIALQFSRLSYTVLPLSTTIDINEEQAAKALCPILVMLLGMVMEVKE